MSDSELSDQLELDVSEDAIVNTVSQSQPAESINQSRISFAQSVQKEDFQFPSSLLSTKTKEGEGKHMSSSSSMILSFTSQQKESPSMRYEDFTRPQSKKKRSPINLDRLVKKPPPAPKQEDLSQCTFQPNINRSNRITRNSQEYYQDMIKFEESKQERIHQVRSSLEAQQEVFEFKPHICDKSNRILDLSSYTTYPSHLRLFKSPSCDTHKLPKQATHDSFTPNVNRRSKNIVRDRNVSEILYEDAVRRSNKSYDHASESYMAPNGNSRKIIRSHFESEFEKTCSSYNLYEDDKVNYSMFTLILEALHLVSGQEPNLGIKLWDDLTQGGLKLRIRKLKQALHVILKYETKSDSDRMMQKVFAKMYEHRISSLLALDKPKETISPKSAPKVSKKGRVENSLLKKGKELSDRMRKLVDLSKERELDGCTFVPNVSKSKFKSKIDKERKGQKTHEHLFSLSKAIRARKELKIVLREQAKLEEDQVHCTFSPEILRRKTQHKQENSLIAKQIQKPEKVATQKTEKHLAHKKERHVIVKPDSQIDLKKGQRHRLKSDNNLKGKRELPGSREKLLKRPSHPRRKTTENNREGNSENDFSEPLWSFSSLNVSEGPVSNESAFDISIHIGSTSHSKLHINPELNPEEAVEDFSVAHGLSADEHRQLLEHVKQLIN